MHRRSSPSAQGKTRPSRSARVTGPRCALSFAPNLQSRFANVHKHILDQTSQGPLSDLSTLMCGQGDVKVEVRRLAAENQNLKNEVKRLSEERADFKVLIERYEQLIQHLCKQHGVDVHAVEKQSGIRFKT